MGKLSPDQARKMREGSVRARAARAPTIQQRLAAAHAVAQYQIAEQWVHAAMREGLEWAVENPDAFIKGGGQTIGVVLTDAERAQVRKVLETLLARLTKGPRLLWWCPGGRRPGGQNKKTIERALAEHGARRGW